MELSRILLQKKANKSKCECRLGSILRLLAADGSFVPVPACAEVLLFGPHDLLQGAHVGPGRGAPRRDVSGSEGESKCGGQRGEGSGQEKVTEFSCTSGNHSC